VRLLPGARWLRRTVLGVLVVVAIGALYYFVTLFQVWRTGESDQARHVDAIVVLGAAQYNGTPSPLLASRLDHAFALYQQGLAPLVVVTGGKLPADRFTEADSEAKYLMERGVPEAAILREESGRTSWDSLGGVASMLRERGLRRVLLVSDPFHSMRIRGMAGELDLDAYVSPTRTSPIRGMAAFRRMLKEAAGVGVARIIGWHRLVDLSD
jgi:uncharacterized SAM-binding protein YcdF (DUF218 family)